MYNYNEDYVRVCKKLSFSDEEMVELYSIIEEILTHDCWNDMVKNRHHFESRALHSLTVCCQAWKRAKKNKKVDTKAVAIGGLLHDFFFYDWQTEKADIIVHNIKRKAYQPKAHGFVHPLIALDNASRYFPHLIDSKVEDIIIKHMWPLTIKPPKYKEAWLVCMADKSASLDVLKSPKKLPLYLGLVRKGKK